MTHIMYSQTAFLCAVVLAILLDRTLRVSDNSKTKRAFIKLLVFSILFCIVDAIWGIFASHTLIWGFGGLIASTYGFHTMAAVASFMWLYFTSTMFNREKIVKYIMGASYVLVAAQLVLLYSNIFTGKLFFFENRIDANLNIMAPYYETTPWRKLLFYMQFANYVMMGLFAARKYFIVEKKSDTRAKNVIVFSMVAVFTGVLQAISPNLPMYSAGFLISCVVIFEFIITEEQMHFTIEQTAEASRSDLLKSLSGIYFSIYHYDIRNEVGNAIYRSQGTAQQLLDSIPMSEVIKRFEKVDLTPEVAKKNRDFWDFTTLPARLKSEKYVSRDIHTKKFGWVQMTFVPYKYDEDGELTEFLWLSREIDKDKKRELEIQKELEIAYEEAKRANKAKTEFLSRMSHDIKTPMNGIIGMTRLAKENKSNPEKLDDCLEKIDISSEHLLTLLNDVLALSKIESGKVVLAHDLVNLIEVSKMCFAVMESTMISRNIETEICNHSIDSPYVYTDAVRMRQVILNVLSNAVKFTPDGGKITIRFDSEPGEDSNHIYVVINISDTGIGMSEEFRKKIFEPFSQEDEHGARSMYMGTGLGMAIVKETMDLFGGSVTVNSTPNKGTSVRLVFPLEKGKEPDETGNNQVSEVEETPIQGLKVLLVEDNDINREIASEILKESGVEVVEAVDGQKAVQEFAKSETNEYDCIFMDVMMPTMNGYEATMAIRAMKRSDASTVPIIAMTANCFAEDEKKAIAVGMNEHLSKPVDPDKIVKTLRKYVH